MKILRAWVNRVLTAEHLTPEILCEEDVHGVISLLHKGGETTILPSDWRPVVLMDSINQLLGSFLARNVAVAQYASIKSALERTLGPQGWSVSQRSFIAGARSLNEQDLHDNLAYF
jgi:hypothetical protein